MEKCLFEGECLDVAVMNNTKLTSNSCLFIFAQTQTATVKRNECGFDAKHMC